LGLASLLQVASSPTGEPRRMLVPVSDTPLTRPTVKGWWNPEAGTKAVFCGRGRSRWTAARGRPGGPVRLDVFGGRLSICLPRCAARVANALVARLLARVTASEPYPQLSAAEICDRVN